MKPLAAAFVLLTASVPASNHFTYPDGNQEPRRDFSPLVLPDTAPPLLPQQAASQLFIQYEASYQTAHYECWGPSGLSDQWQGITAPDVANAGVVRRGRTFRLLLPSELPAPTKINIYSPSPPRRDRLPVTSWPVTYDGRYASISVPADAPIGDYRIVYGDHHCTAYVIFDTYQHGETLGDQEFASWAYDDTPFGEQDFDYLNHLVYGPGPASSFTPNSDNIYSYRGGEAGRHDGIFGERLVELAASVHGWGALNPMEAGANLYTITGQRLVWTSGGAYFGMSDGYVNTFDRVFNGEGVRSGSQIYTARELSVAVAEAAALGRGRVNHLPDEYVISYGQCMNFASVGGALARAIGIPSRSCYTVATSGWPQSFHVWTELFLGTTPFDPPGWTSPWWKFDSADQRRQEVSANFEGSIMPPRMHGWSDFVQNALTLDDCSLRGGEYYGSFDTNITLCDTPAMYGAILLRPEASTPPTPPNSMIWTDYKAADSPWMIVDTWSTVHGTGPTGKELITSEANGYALNALMNLRDGSPFELHNGETNDDLPVLQEGMETRGVIGGLGTSYYVIDVSDGDPVTVRVIKGAYENGFGIRLYASLDTPPTVRGIQPIADYTSHDGALRLDSIPVGAQRLVLMAVGADDQQERFGNQVSLPYSLLLERDHTPQVLAAFPENGAAISGVSEVSIMLLADSGELRLNGKPIATASASNSSTLQIRSDMETAGLPPWSTATLELIAERDGIPLRRYFDFLVREPYVLLYDGFEVAGAEHWIVETSAPSVTGSWVIATPEPAVSNENEQTQPGAPAEGLQCLFTGRNPGGDAATNDVDNGSVAATLENIPLHGHRAIQLSYDLWWFNRDAGEDEEDFFLVEVRFNDDPAWTSLHLVSSTAPPLDWTTFVHDLSPLADGKQAMDLRFTASDGPGAGNLVEAALDNVEIRAINALTIDDGMAIF